MATQPIRIATDDVKALNGGTDSTGDVHPSPQPLGVQRGRLGDRVRRGPVGGGVPTPNRHRPADIDHLGDDTGSGDISPGTCTHTGVDTGCHLDGAAPIGLVYRILDGSAGGTAVSAIAVVNASGSNVEIPRSFVGGSQLSHP